MVLHKEVQYSPIIPISIVKYREQLMESTGFTAVQLYAFYVGVKKRDDLCHCTAAVLQYCSSAVVHYCTTALLNYCTATVFHCCSTALLQYCRCTTAVLEYCTTAVLQYCTTAVLLYCSQYCTAAKLHYAFLRLITLMESIRDPNAALH